MLPAGAVVLFSWHSPSWPCWPRCRVCDVSHTATRTVPASRTPQAVQVHTACCLLQRKDVITRHQVAVHVQVHTACCLLVVVDSVEGASVAHSQALSLVRAALQDFLCDLCAELLRFLYPACDLDMEALHEPLGAPPPMCFENVRTYCCAFVIVSLSCKTAAPGVHTPAPCAAGGAHVVYRTVSTKQ